MFYWLALTYVQGIGNIKYKALISHFGSPEDVFNADTEELCRVDGIGAKSADAIKSFNDFKAVEEEIKSASQKGVKIIKYPDFPQNLKRLEDSPPVLYIKGDLLEADNDSFGIVGARKASMEKLAFAEDISYRLSSRGITIVSGMADGIDTAAHKGALKAGGRTISVLGSGVDIVYPHSNRGLYDKIAECGAVVSEFRLGTPPIKENFPKRNRIISGLSSGLLVVEATSDSGSLITADFALKQGKKIFAVPGDIKKDKSKGTNNLIKKGALLVDGAQDIFDNIAFDRITSGVKAKERKTEGLSDNEAKIYGIIKDEAMHIDDIIKRSSSQAAIVSGVLLSLELKGYIRQFSGKMFLRV